MYVDRRTYIAKRGRYNELVALWKEARQGPPALKGAAGNFRIYWPIAGPIDAIVIEYEFESLEEYGKFWSKYELTEFGKRLNEATESGGTNELWLLVE